VKLLLDTHIWVWSVMEASRLSRRVLAHLRHPQNELWLSPISIWELLNLCSKGRIELNQEPAAWVRSVLSATPFLEAPLTHEIALESHFTGLAQKDPADRLLAATAKVLDLTLVTADENLVGNVNWKHLQN